MDIIYVPVPPWIMELPALDHFRVARKAVSACAKGKKLPFSFEQSTPQTDAVLHHVLKRVIKRAHTRCYTRSLRISSIPTRHGGNDHLTGPWEQLVKDVLREDLQVSVPESTDQSRDDRECIILNG